MCVYLRADLDHIAIECRDVKSMLAFYMETLRFAPCGLEEYEKGKRPFPSVRVSGLSIIDFFKSDNARGLSGNGHFCFSIGKSDLVDLRKRLEKVGITVEEPAKRSGARGDGMSIYFRDPEENMLEFKYY
ncbi:unnamed protein product [Agarophyton chilense]